MYIKSGCVKGGEEIHGTMMSSSLGRRHLDRFMAGHCLVSKPYELSTRASKRCTNLLDVVLTPIAIKIWALLAT